jgi:hypothetical protein
MCTRRGIKRQGVFFDKMTLDRAIFVKNSARRNLAKDGNRFGLKGFLFDTNRHESGVVLSSDWSIERA